MRSSVHERISNIVNQHHPPLLRTYRVARPCGATRAFSITQNKTALLSCVTVNNTASAGGQLSIATYQPQERHSSVNATIAGPRAAVRLSATGVPIKCRRIRAVATAETREKHALYIYNIHTSGTYAVGQERLDALCTHTKGLKNVWAS